jgi:DNA polymerase-3 subunit epsilon
MKLVYIDTETGGLDPRQHDLLSFGVVSEGDRDLSIVHKLDTYRVSPSALAINKIDLIDIGKTGLDTFDFINVIENVIPDPKAKPNDNVYVGHNINFDARFLDAVDPTRREGWMYQRIMRNHIDTKALALSAIVQGKIPKEVGTSLEPLCKHFGISIKGHHNALTDCHMTKALYEILITL